MFKFLKDKLRDSIAKISKTIDIEATTVSTEEPKPGVEIKKGPTTEELLKELEEKPVEELEHEEAPTVEVKVEEKPEEEKIEPTIKHEERLKEKPKRKSFFAKLKEKFKHEEELPSLEGFKEVAVKTELEEQKEAAAKRKLEEEKILAEKKVEEKIEKKEIPTIQELTERKEEEIEEIKEEVKELKGEIEKEKIEPEKEEIEKTKEKVAGLKEAVKEEEKKGLFDISEIQRISEHAQKTSFFDRLKEKIITKKINEKQFENLFWDLEVALLENNVAVEVIDKIKEDLKKSLVEKPIKRTKITTTITSSLKNSIKDVLKIESFDLLQKIKEKKPFVICFVGINGSGKTTTIAKITKLFQRNNLSVVLAASDTFRAASIEQLQKHADNLGVKLIKHDYGADPAAVAYDSIEHAKAQNIDAVLIDTAGRMHSNQNLIDEMKKIVRVANPDLNIFVGESITGNDCVEQAKIFNEAIGIDAIILAKADIDEKGGAAVSVSYVTKKPIIYLGTGQNYEDLQEFDVNTVMQNLGLAA